MKSHNQANTAPIENDAFWRQHHTSQQLSGLTRSDYCRQHGLNYDRFGYWLKKQKDRVDGGLIAVKLKSTSLTATSATLCTLELKNGHCLKIHDTQALALILARYE